MKINLKEQAVKGAIATLRCGGKIKIDSHSHHASIRFDGEWEMNYRDNHGSYVSETMEHPFDIISIEPPAFDWSTVKGGMAFLHIPSDTVLYYIGEDFANKEHYAVLKHDGMCLLLEKKYLTRTPEHDHPCVKGEG